jgi:hypothetical protein
VSAEGEVARIGREATRLAKDGRLDEAADLVVRTIERHPDDVGLEALVLDVAGRYERRAAEVDARLAPIEAALQSPGGWIEALRASHRDEVAGSARAGDLLNALAALERGGWGARTRDELRAEVDRSTERLASLRRARPLLEARVRELRAERETCVAERAALRARAADLYWRWDAALRRP